MLSDVKLIEQFKRHKKEAERGLSYQKEQDTINQAFFSGNSMVKFQMGGKDAQKPMVKLYQCKPILSSVLGFMIQLRRKPDYQAVIEDSVEQQARSEYLDGISDYVRKNGNAPQIESRQDLDMLVQGYGAVDANITYIASMPDRVPGGEVKFERCTNDVWWDPNARETNLTDTRFVYRRKEMRNEDAEFLFDAKQEDLEADIEPDAQLRMEVGKYKTWERGTTKSKDMCIVTYYQWWDYQSYYQVENPLYKMTDPSELPIANILAQSMVMIKEKRAAERDEYGREDLFSFDPMAQELVLDSEIYKDIKVLFDKMNIQAEFVEYQRKCFYTAILSGEKVFNKFKSPDQQGFTIKFKTGIFDEINKCWTGMCTGMREPANYANKALTEMMYVIASNSKGGVMYEKGAVPDAVKFERDYASTKAAIEVNDGALANGRIQPKAVAAVPTGLEGVLAEAKNALAAAPGVNAEFLGSSENTQVSALLEKQRIRQVVTTLAAYFDSISLYQIESARLMITYIRILTENYPGRRIRLLTEEGATKFTTLMADRLADEYEVDIGEVPETAAEKEETAKLLIDMAANLITFGINIYPDIIPALPIKNKYKQALIERMSPPPQQPDPVKEAMVKSELDLKQADVMLKQANAQKAMTEAELNKKELVTGGDNPPEAPNTDMQKIEADLIKHREDIQLKREQEAANRQLQWEISVNQIEANKEIKFAEIAANAELQLHAQAQAPEAEDGDKKDANSAAVSGILEAFASIGSARKYTVERDKNGMIKGGESRPAGA